MSNINISMFTNRAMLSMDTLRYCESFYQYLFHLTHFFAQSLTLEEFRWLNFIIQCIKVFLLGAPSTDKYRVVVARYSRLLPKLQRICDEQSSELESAE